MDGWMFRMSLLPPSVPNVTAHLLNAMPLKLNCHIMFFFDQLADFRMIVFRMLSGPDDTGSTFSNYEITRDPTCCHHHLHRVTCACPAHHMPHLRQIQDIPDISFMDSSTFTSSYPCNAGPLHED